MYDYFAAQIQAEEIDSGQKQTKKLAEKCIWITYALTL